MPSNSRPHFDFTHHASAASPLSGDPGLNLDELIAASLEQLVKCGPVSDPAMLRSMLPEMLPESNSLEIDGDACARQFVLIELIKLDMAMAAETGRQHRIERYTNALPDLLSVDSVPLDLVMEEIQLRKEAGERPNREEYNQRFPQFAAMLGHLSSASESTSAIRKLGPPPEFSLGSQIDDFMLVQKLGQGAFAHVYLARQVSMRRLVALKLSRGGGDEPQALAQFDHPNIVRVYDQRELKAERVHLLYMQFLPGGTLSDAVKRVQTREGTHSGLLLLECVDARLLLAAQAVPDRSSVRDWIATAPWPTVVSWIGIQLSRALQEAHAHGVLHRDVKPANVLLSAEGIPKLADFNVSFAGAAGRAGAAAMFGGSIGYMAPEHLQAISAKGLVKEVKVAEPADLYSLAVLLWELWQGSRPFVTTGVAISWSDSVAQQLASRDRVLKVPQRDHSASERVLETTLRQALSAQPAQRIASGAEMAGRLRLALHPEAAMLFDPGERALASRISRLSPWLVACIVILLPNMAGGCFNYQYNYHVVMKDMQSGLQFVSWWVNLTFFPIGAAIVISFALEVIRAIKKVRHGEPVSATDLKNTIDFGHRSALIGGSLWLIAGILFPTVFALMYADFSLGQAAHLLVSSMICGGVALIYPFFGMTLVSTLVYYPQFVRKLMQDDEFDERVNVVVRRSGSYLLIAQLIPLLGVALLVSSDSSLRNMFMLIAIGASVLGLLASWKAYQIIVRTWSRMAEVLSSLSTVVPGEG